MDLFEFVIELGVSQDQKEQLLANCSGISRPLLFFLTSISFLISSSWPISEKSFRSDIYNDRLIASWLNKGIFRLFSNFDRKVDTRCSLLIYFEHNFREIRGSWHLLNIIWPTMSGAAFYVNDFAFICIMGTQQNQITA